MAASTDAMYNAPFRSIEFKILMFLNGHDAEPLEITTSNYLVDADILEEAYSTSEGPFGGVTSNELSFTLYNQDSIFSPTNSLSPYYGRMRKGVECQAYVRPTEADWDAIGVFYVTDWSANITGTTASITANDALYSVINSSGLGLPVVPSTSVTEYTKRIFNAIGTTVAIDAALQQDLAMAYTAGTTGQTLTDITNASMAMCNCAHNGDIVVKPLTTSLETRAVVSDSDQVIAVDAKYSIMSGYSGASVTYNAPQESAEQDVLTVSDMNVTRGASMTPYMALATAPLVRLTSASVVGDYDAYVSGMSATSGSIRLSIENSGDTASMPISVRGTVVTSTASTIGATGDNVLYMDNTFIQSAGQAEKILSVLQRYVASDTPVITVQARGNPLLNIGDKLVVQSDIYNVAFTGILVRQQFAYNGALSSTMTLLDASLLEVN